ncbi:unnamed protein product [Moneuplotes crassus]|uniref:Aldehyde dehydrogenase n=1 Tax=Euplotes crassus TaxID=5936 RepID=A0AAD1UHA3_EUPCR|nr:unnamed protein product [Moneuplotes crassus]
MKEDSPETVHEYFKDLRKAFYTDKTHDIKWRRKQLGQIILAFEEMKEEISVALEKDLGRDHFISLYQEITAIPNRAKEDSANLEYYMKPEKRDTPVLLAPAKSRMVYQPLGAVCIYGAWNYPFVTTFSPLICAVAAGNCALVKPSEMAPHSSAVMRTIVEKYLDNECFKVAEGGAEVSIACSQMQWDKICFTGSPQKGSLVAQAAAKNLVPCLLELGGKCTTIVDEDANAQFAGFKVMSSRLANSGQICTSPDYVLIHESKKDEFIESAKATIKDSYGEDPQKDVFYSRMINEFHTERVFKLCSGHGGKVVTGGKCDIKDRYMEPTIIENPSLDSEIMKEEIFGPILPVVTFKDFQEVIDHMHEREKPLAMYYFGSVFGEHKKILEERVQAGGMVVNDCVIHALNNRLAFGGVGQSGQGRYLGIDGFRNFSNQKAVLVKPTINIDSVNKMIMPPFTEEEKAKLMNMLTMPYYQSHAQKLLLAIALVLTILTYLFVL